MENKKENKNNNRSFLLYVGLGLLIFFGVQQYNSTVNSPESKSFTIFKNDIQSGNVSEATIKEQSNLVEFKLNNDDTIYQTEYPEGFEGEVFQLLVDQDIILNTDTEPAGFQYCKLFQIRFGNFQYSTNLNTCGLHLFLPLLL